MEILGSVYKNKNFKIFLRSDIDNPQFLDHTFSVANIIDFRMTPSIVEQKLLIVTEKKEQSKLKNNIIDIMKKVKLLKQSIRNQECD